VNGPNQCPRSGVKRMGLASQCLRTSGPKKCPTVKLSCRNATRWRITVARIQSITVPPMPCAAALGLQRRREHFCYSELAP
jgi:hypothetical protein